MGVRNDVMELLDRRIDYLEAIIDHFDKYGNFQDPSKVIQHAVNINLIKDLKDIKNQLEYTIDWGEEND